MDVFDVLSSQLRRMSVCPHDTSRNVFGWYLMNSYLQSRLSIRLRFEPQENFLAERDAVLGGGYDVVYANPYSAVLFARHLGFVPVARPAGTFDEAYVVASAGWTPPIAGQRLTVASATDKLIVHALGLTLLPTLGLDESRIDINFTGNHAATAKAVMDGEADLGFVFNETWSGLSAYTQSALQVLGRTNQSQAFHCFMVSPDLADRATEVQTLLTAITTDPDAAEIMRELNFARGIDPAGAADLQALFALVPQTVS